MVYSSGRRAWWVGGGGPPARTGTVTRRSRRPWHCPRTCWRPRRGPPSGRRPGAPTSGPPSPRSSPTRAPWRPGTGAGGRPSTTTPSTSQERNPWSTSRPPSLAFNISLVNKLLLIQTYLIIPLFRVCYSFINQVRAQCNYNTWIRGEPRSYWMVGGYK